MRVMIMLMGCSVAAMFVAGVWLELRPAPRASPRWLRGGLLANLLVFGLALAGTLLLGAQEVLAAEPIPGATAEITLGKGLALIGIGLPTAIAAIGAGIALGPVGSAALAVIAEKPELFGRTLIYMGLAEGVAIYGLVMSILMLGKL